MFVSTNSFAALSINQVATCFMTDVWISKLMEKQGNQEAVKAYEQTALFWAEEGAKRFGGATFDRAWKGVQSKVFNMTDNQLIATKQQCLKLMPETLK